MSSAYHNCLTTLLFFFFFTINQRLFLMGISRLSTWILMCSPTYSTLPSSWIILISTLKSRSPILPASHRHTFLWIPYPVTSKLRNQKKKVTSSLFDWKMICVMSPRCLKQLLSLRPRQVLRPRAASRRRGGRAGEAGGRTLRQAGRVHGHDECGGRDGLRGRHLRDAASPRRPPQVLHPQPPGVAIRHWGGTEHAAASSFEGTFPPHHQEPLVLDSSLAGTLGFLQPFVVSTTAGKIMQISPVTEWGSVEQKLLYRSWYTLLFNVGMIFIW